MKNQFHPKYHRKYIWNSALNFFVATWGLPGDLVSNIINKEGYWKPKKLPGSPQKATKNLRAEIQKYFRWYFGWNWFFMRTFWNFEINWPLVCKYVDIFIWKYLATNLLIQSKQKRNPKGIQSKQICTYPQKTHYSWPRVSDGTCI